MLKHLKGIWICIIAIVLLFPNSGLQVDAESKADVLITVDQDTIYSDANINVNIIFNDVSFYNENLYLGYHVYDEKDERILYESPRYLITIDEQGVCNQNVAMSIGDLKKQYSELKYEFDIVDENQMYWFSTNDDIQMETQQVRCMLKGWERFISRLKIEIESSPVILCINIIFVLLFFVACLVIRKNKIISFK
ncbi:MAG: hypothetical protein ACI4DK_16115 [Lachnospiraceae bacterium]